MDSGGFWRFRQAVVCLSRIAALLAPTGPSCAGVSKWRIFGRWPAGSGQKWAFLAIMNFHRWQRWAFLVVCFFTGGKNARFWSLPFPQVAKTWVFGRLDFHRWQRHAFLVIWISTGGKDAHFWSFGFPQVAKMLFFGRSDFHCWQRRASWVIGISTGGEDAGFSGVRWGRKFGVDGRRGSEHFRPQSQHGPL